MKQKPLEGNNGSEIKFIEPGREIAKKPCLIIFLMIFHVNVVVVVTLIVNSERQQGTYNKHTSAKSSVFTLPDTDTDVSGLQSHFVGVGVGISVCLCRSRSPQIWGISGAREGTFVLSKFLKKVSM